MNKKSILILIIVGLLLILVDKINAQKINGSFPEETLVSRIERIKKTSDARITFNTEQLKDIHVKALIVENLTVEQILDKSLSATVFTYKKVSDNLYAIIRKTTNESPKNSGSSGSLKGRIVESETSEPIPGAAIRLSDKQYAVSDFNGYYVFPKVANGKVVLEVSYVGFKPEKTEIIVRAGENTYDIKLSGSTMLSEVQVKGIQRMHSAVPHTTEKLLVAEIKGLNVMASGISSEQISKSADRNAAQAVQRVSGVTIVDDKFVVVRGLNQRYNLTYLNDNVAPSTETNSRAFALDLIPSRIIDKILVLKSPSPENQGDATGGVIKVYTKDAKAVKHFEIELQTGYREGTTFNNNFLTYQGGKTDFLGFDDGTRKLPSSVPGYGRLDVAKISQKDYAETFSPILSYGKKNALPNMQFTTNYYNSFPVLRKNLSTLTSLSYKNERIHADVFRQQGINDNNMVSTNDAVQHDNRNTETAQLNLLQNFTLSLNDSNNIRFKNFLLQQGQSVTMDRISMPRLPSPTYLNASQNRDILLSYTQRFLYAGNLGGTLTSGKHKWLWNAGYSYSRQELPDQRVSRFTAPTNYASIGDPELQWRARGRVNDPDLMKNTIPLTLGIMSRLWSRNEEGVYNGSLDYTFRTNNWLSLKLGTFHQWKERQLYRKIFTVHEGDIRNAYSDYSTPAGYYGDYVNPNLIRFTLQELPYVWSTDYLRDDGTGLKVLDRTTGSDAYIATEQNNSSYFALSLSPAGGKFEMYGGLRYEYNRQKIAAAIPPSDPSSPDAINTPLLIDYPLTSWLPSLNLSYKPVDSWVFRAAYGKTVNRWEFREASPYTETDYENNQTLMGNPDLKAAKADNYDIRIEFYPQGNAQGETVSLGAFYKKINNPIERIVNSSRLSSEARLPIITFQNARRATIQGIELEIRKSLEFVPAAFFRHLSMVANLSLIKSEAVQDSVNTSNPFFYSFRRPLQGQAPYLVNAGLYYDNAGSGTKVSAIYNIVGTRIYAAGTNYQYNSVIRTATQRGSLLELPMHSLDISISQRIVKSLQVKFSVQNLLNQEIRMAEDFNFTNKYEPVKETKDGLQEGDNISSVYSPGRYFQLTLSYSF